MKVYETKKRRCLYIHVCKRLYQVSHMYRIFLQSICSSLAEDLSDYELYYPRYLIMLTK